LTVDEKHKSNLFGRHDGKVYYVGLVLNNRQISWNYYECGQLNRRRNKKIIAAGNRSFFANKKIFQNKLITRKTKERLYHTVIRPVAVYGSECWVLTENIKQKLLVFEMRLLRRIFGPTQKTNGEWREKTNEEL